jgi:hypothetical protein
MFKEMKSYRLRRILVAENLSTDSYIGLGVRD